MGLNAVLVDRARRLHSAPTPQKVEGTTQFVPVHGPWFKVRLTLPAAATTEAAARVRAGLTDDGGARSKVVERPFILFGIRDSEGNSLIGEDGRSVVNAHDRLEIESPQLGLHVYEITENPAPIRKKRKVIGYNASLSRVEEQEFEPRLP
jgi:hypothetical protein